MNIRQEIFVLCYGLMLGTASLHGCTSAPTLGDRMMDQGEGTADIGKQWTSGNEKALKGEKLIKKGKKMVDDGREEMRDGEDNIAKGKELIEEGKRMMQESEQAYKNRFPDSYRRIYQTPSPP
jgi:hypothetical protein